MISRNKAVMINRPKNTKDNGFLEFLVYPEDGKFVGVCLTFDIIEVGDSLEDVLKSVREASILHLRKVIDRDMSEELLNRHAPSEYWEKYFSLLKDINRPNLRKLPDWASETLPYDPRSLSHISFSY